MKGIKAIRKVLTINMDTKLIAEEGRKEVQKCTEEESTKNTIEKLILHEFLMDF